MRFKDCLLTMYIETETRPLRNGGHLAILSLDHPATRNSMTLEMGMHFNRELHQIAGHNPPRVLIITGKNGIFSSGGDFNLLRGFAEKTPLENREFMVAFYRLFLVVRDMPFPVIAAVNGHAIGASLALALACDLRYFVPAGKYAFNFVRLGIHPGMGSSFLVREIVGFTQAQELLLTGRTINGEEALTRGLCHGLFSTAEILDQVIKIAEEIGENTAPAAVRLTKQGLNRAHATLDEALVFEAESQAENFSSRDFREALRAIAEKRPPVFTGE